MAQAIRIRYAEAGQDKSDEIESWIKDWSVAIPDRTTFRYVDFDGRPAEGTAHYEARVYLDDGEDLDKALTELSEDVFAGIKWYVIHTIRDCTHDRENENKPCSWTLERERGNVPDEYL